MELKETIELMNSEDYKDRFKAEYYQTSIRIKKLNSLINKYINDDLYFEPTTNLYILIHQQSGMKEYLQALEKRAEIENIEL